MADDDISQADRFPRRTLRRQGTRRRILAEALKLFRQIGYGATTMNAIAEAADIHVTTLFTHFKTKRDLVSSLNDAGIDVLAQMVAKEKGNTPFFDFFRAVVLSNAEKIEGEIDPALTLWHELERDPELTMVWVRYEQRQVALLADYVAADYGLDAAADYTPILVSSLMVSAAWNAHRRWSEAAAQLDLETETVKALEIAEAMARAVLPRKQPTRRRAG